LQRTATHCNTLQHAAKHCNTLQLTATHCNALQHTATHCNTQHNTAPHCRQIGRRTNTVDNFEFLRLVGAGGFGKVYQVTLSICLFVCLSVCLSIYLSICVPDLIHQVSYVRHDSFICVTRLIRLSDMPHSYL